MPSSRPPIEQEIGFTNTTDGVRIAYAAAGNPKGEPVVVVLGWATQLLDAERHQGVHLGLVSEVDRR